VIQVASELPYLPSYKNVEKLSKRLRPRSSQMRLLTRPSTRKASRVFGWRRLYAATPSIIDTMEVVGMIRVKLNPARA
jgi:hypothetical protein